MDNVFLNIYSKISNLNVSRETCNELESLISMIQEKNQKINIISKKMYEKEIMKMESIKFNIETQILHMESVSVMVETVNTIKNTSGHIQLLNKNLDITKLETVIEDMCEQRDTSKDIESIFFIISSEHGCSRQKGLIVVFQRR